MLERLKALNNRPVYSISDGQFRNYGKVVTKYDFSELISYMERQTEIPEDGNVYYPSVKEMEALKIYEELKNNLYGRMDIQIGYCNGRNSSINGLEYHRGCEVNIAVTDQAFFLGHIWDMINNTYYQKNAEIFYVKKGQAIIFYETTLHFSPCKVREEGFKTVVVLLRGTNLPLEEKTSYKEEEDKILFMKNKWLIVHENCLPLISRGAYAGLKGENVFLKY